LGKILMGWFAADFMFLQHSEVVPPERAYGSAKVAAPKGTTVGRFQVNPELWPSCLLNGSSGS
jgi:hypothetical protein